MKFLANGSWWRGYSCTPPSPLVIRLFVRSVTLKLCALHVCLLCGHVLRSSIWRAYCLLSKFFLRSRRDICQYFPALRGESLLYGTKTKRALCLTMWILQTHPANDGSIEISCTGSTCTRRSRRWYQLRLGSSLYHRWSDFHWWWKRFLVYCLLFDGGSRTLDFPSPTKAMLLILKIVGFFIK